jgi:hypothetical protein
MQVVLVGVDADAELAGVGRGLRTPIPVPPAA